MKHYPEVAQETPPSPRNWFGFIAMPKLLTNTFNAAVHRHEHKEDLVLENFTPDQKTKERLTVRDLLAIDQMLGDVGPTPEDGNVLRSCEGAE